MREGCDQGVPLASLDIGVETAKGALSFRDLSFELGDMSQGLSPLVAQSPPLELPMPMNRATVVAVAHQSQQETAFLRLDIGKMSVELGDEPQA
jgi:hypothetical protein